jgi:NADH-quinone oxidoreductase subunit M
MIALPLILPLAAAGVLLLVKKENRTLIRALAVGSTGLAFALALLLWLRYDASPGGLQFEVNLPWVPSLGIRYHAGLDGVSAVMILLHGLVSFSAVLVSASIRERVKEYHIFLLILIASIYGVFTSFDLFFLYFFYEMAVIPMYPLIGMWGSRNKEYASMKLTLYITAGAVLALVGILALYQFSPVKTFDLIELREAVAREPFPPNFQKWCAAAILFGFGVIASLWPTHSWSPIGYAAAPSAVSMLHAGVLKKLGPYLMIRIALAFLPEGSRFWLSIIAWLAMVNILYAGYCAMVQRDLKFVIGFSSVSHMGYVLLALACLNEVALNGAVFLMFSHGVMAASAFALIGYVYDQTHTRMIDELKGGLAKPLPFIAVCFLATAMASLGLPGFSNFAAEILIFFGAWKTYPVQTVAAAFGLLVTAVYLLRAARSVFFGEARGVFPDLRDARTLVQKAPFVLLLGALLIFGFFPNWMVGKMGTTVKALAVQFEPAGARP